VSKPALAIIPSAVADRRLSLKSENPRPTLGDDDARDFSSRQLSTAALTGNITGAVNCFYDITERKHIDQEYVLTRAQVEELTINPPDSAASAMIDRRRGPAHLATAAGCCVNRSSISVEY